MNRISLPGVMAFTLIMAGCGGEPSARPSSSPAPDSAGGVPDTPAEAPASGEVREISGPSTPEYIFIPARARRQVREHYQSECEDISSKPRLPYRSTFEKAMKGDPDALYTVFFNEHYHSGDNESWAFTGWPLAHLAGDERFAAFLKRLSASERAAVFDEIFYSGSDIPTAITNGYFAKTLPRVAAIYQADQAGN